MTENIETELINPLDKDIYSAKMKFVEDISLSDLDLGKLIFKNSKSNTHDDTRLSIYKSIGSDIFIGRIKSLNIQHAAYEKEEVIESISEIICMDWEEFAKENDEKLSVGAISYKEKLLENFQEIKPDSRKTQMSL